MAMDLALHADDPELAQDAFSHRTAFEPKRANKVAKLLKQIGIRYDWDQLQWVRRER